MKQLLNGFILLIFCQIAFAAPKLIRLEYNLTKNGKLVAKVQEKFTQDGKNYHIESVAKGVGLYALMGQRKQISDGKMTKAGLKPTRYQLIRPDNAKKSLDTQFDWANNNLKMQLDDEIREAKLEAGTQDILSLMYQFVLAPPTKDSINLAVTTGKKLRSYQYQVQDKKTPLSTKAGKFSTLKLINAADEIDDQKQLFLAMDKQYIPVKIIINDDGDVLEQTLTRVRLD